MTNEEAIKSLKSLKSFHNGSYGTALELAIKALEQQPKMGEWLKNGELCKCSNCHHNVLFSVIKHYKYCPSCGSYNGGE